MIDLEDVRVIDNHCHAVERAQQSEISAFRQYFTESPDPTMRTRDVAQTVFYRRLITAMATVLEVPANEERVLSARSQLSTDELVGRLLPQALIAGVVVDTGYPAPDAAMAKEDFTAASKAEHVSLLRLEVAFEDLIAKHEHYDDLVEGVRDLVHDVRGRGFAGFKSIAGYRTGLGIRRWPADESRAAFVAAREEVAITGAARLGHKPLLDTLLHLAFEAASRQELPVQFHVGYGDPDVDLRQASPLDLRAVLEEPAYRSMPVVLLHGCWPYFREGAYLASVYGNAYLDLSYAIPFLSRGEMTSMTRAAIGTAPFTKLMYSSDGARVPELHWLGALDGRRVIGAVLGELVADGDLDVTTARRAGEQILHDNAYVLYGFTGSAV